MEESELRLALRSLALFRPVLSEKPVHRLLKLLDRAVLAKHPPAIIDAWGAYAAALLPFGGSLESYLHDFLLHHENPGVKKALAGEDADAALTQQIREELAILSEACALSPGAMRIYLDYDGYLPGWKYAKSDLYAWYSHILETVRKEGFGIFRGCRMFTVNDSGIVPVSESDPISLDQLQGYGWQRSLIMANICALLSGETASDILLYGDSGTGKSSTIKAVVNAKWEEGLRLIEVRPSQLHMIPTLLTELSSQPLKFILFIDDLSFSEENDDFRALKGMLEGSVLSRTENVIIAATSNRRRLIRETFSDREGDDVHANETVQQQTALSDRFGLSIPFMDPGKQEYLHIVEMAAKDVGLDAPAKKLFAGAERFALEKGGRSGRAAKQFVDQVKSGVLKL